MEDISRLTVVNECLKTMSEAPLNTLVNEDHPFIASALSALDLAIIRELSLPWWFNTEFATLQPDAVTRKIAVPQNCLDIDSSTGAGYIVQRGRYLYDRVNQTDQFDTEVRVRFNSYVEFDDMPLNFRLYIMYSAVLDFCTSYDADPQRVQEIQGKYAMARSMVKSSDIRNKQINLLDSPSVASKLNGITWPGSSNYRSRNAGRR